MPCEQNTEARAHQSPFHGIEARALERGVGRHHPPDLSGVMPREIHAGHRDHDVHERLRLLRLPQGERHVRQQDGRHVHRRPFVLEDHGAAAVHQPVRRHEVWHVDGRPDPGLHAGAHQQQVGAPRQEQRHHHEQRQSTHAQQVERGGEHGRAPDGGVRSRGRGTHARAGCRVGASTGHAGISDGGRESGTPPRELQREGYNTRRAADW